MRKSNDHLGMFFMLLTLIAMMKWMMEEILRYYAIASGTIMMVTVGGWVLLAVLSFLFLRDWIVAYRESNQEEENPDLDREMFFLNNDPNISSSEDVTREFRGLHWRFHVHVPQNQELERRQTQASKTKAVQMKYVEGPYCPQEECSMNQKKTYFGKYRFQCPCCSYRISSTENSETLIHDLKKMVDVNKILEG